MSLKSPSSKTMQESVQLNGRKISRIEKNITKLFADLCPEEATSEGHSPLQKHRNSVKKAMKKSHKDPSLIGYADTSSIAS
jgi:hypothetical protein